MGKHNQDKCYLCESQNLAKRDGQVRDDSSLDILECQDCGLVFLSDNKHISEDHYEISGMHGAERPDAKAWLNENKADDTRRLEFLRQKIVNKDIIDFGCGIGGFIEKARDHCMSVAGIELEKAFIPSFQERKLDVFQSLHVALESSKKWDLVSAFHVVEHLTDPRETLMLLTGLLKSGGELIVEVPSSNDALLTHYHCEAFKKFTYWSQHLYLFNIHTFEMLIKQAGLQLQWIKGVQRYPLSNHLYWMSEGKPGGHQTWSFLDSPCLKEAYEANLASLGITDTIMASITVK